MESPREARTFSQVVFTDTPHSYPPGALVTCSCTLNGAFQPSRRDWVGIFKVGWSTTKDYHTFVWVEPCLDEVGKESGTRQAVFKEYYLPKDELDFYQFCYVDGGGQVRGASTPFCFKKPAEEQSPESIVDEELLVITTQEQVELSLREKAELQRELDQLRAENETLKNDRQMERQRAASLKGQNDQNEKERSRLLGDMDQVKEQNENLRSAVQEKEKQAERLKEEMTKQTEERQRDAEEEQNKRSSLDAASRQNQALAQEKYDRAVVKVERLQEEREQLSGRLDAQRAEIATLSCKLREQERELFKMKDGVQLLQVDLQSLEKEKERLSAELQRSQSLVRDMVEVKTENQELHTSPSGQNSPDDDLRAECQTLAGQLQDAQRKLAAEREETRNAKRRSEFLDHELLQLREQLEKVASSCEDAQRMSGKQELQLVEMRVAISEAREVLADKDGAIEEKEQIVTLVTRQKEALARENQTLASDMERLRRALDDFQASPPAAAAPRLQPDAAYPAAAYPAADTADSWQQLQEEEEVHEEINPYENIEIPGDAGEEALVCRLCLEVFPGITQDELEQHEQSHRMCPYCTLSCDAMEQLVYEDHVYSHQV